MNNGPEEADDMIEQKLHRSEALHKAMAQTLGWDHDDVDLQGARCLEDRQRQ